MREKHVTPLARERISASGGGYDKQRQFRKEDVKIRQNIDGLEETSEGPRLSTIVEDTLGKSARASIEELNISDASAIDTVHQVAGLLSAIGNFERIRILYYCLEPRRFADITKDLRLNTSSLAYHYNKLCPYGLITKMDSRYVTTNEGKIALDIVSALASL